MHFIATSIFSGLRAINGVGTKMEPLFEAFARAGRWYPLFTSVEEMIDGSGVNPAYAFKADTPGRWRYQESALEVLDPISKESFHHVSRGTAVPGTAVGTFLVAGDTWADWWRGPVRGRVAHLDMAHGLAVVCFDRLLQLSETPGCHVLATSRPSTADMTAPLAAARAAALGQPEVIASGNGAGPVLGTVFSPVPTHGIFVPLPGMETRGAP